MEKRLSARTTAKENNNVEGSGTVNEHMALNWFKHFKEGNSSLKNKPRLMKLFVVEDRASLEMAEQQPSTSTLTLSIELGPSPSIDTLMRSVWWTNTGILEIAWNITKLLTPPSMIYQYPLEQDSTQGQFSKQNLTNLNSEFFFS